MQLVIGNKNYSSWSMRPWVLMRGLDIPFEEHKLSFLLGLDGGFREAMLPISPAARVPVLIDGGLTVWDSLAIAEYLHERFPTRGVWPAALAARTRARSVCAEMHAGFGALRNQFPMNIEASLPEIGAAKLAADAAVARDVARVSAMWSAQLGASGGPFLFGAFGIADAYFAPVCSRFKTYAVPLPGVVAAYVGRVLALPAMQQWVRDAVAENDFLVEDEPYRQAPVAGA